MANKSSVTAPAGNVKEKSTAGAKTLVTVSRVCPASSILPVEEKGELQYKLQFIRNGVQETRDVEHSVYKQVNNLRLHFKATHDLVLTVEKRGNKSIVTNLALKLRQDNRQRGAQPSEEGENSHLVRLKVSPDGNVALDYSPDGVTTEQIEDILSLLPKDASLVRPGMSLGDRYMVVRKSEEMGYNLLFVDPMSR